ncbi:MAG: glutamate--tRNA ligase [Parcubacteria group bacterium]|nr:glutamate--tRNA ligase [Parcubacteria group bacterium]
MTTDQKNEKVIVRFAPSPTGNLHIGSVRTALFNSLFARQKGGIFRLRIEDTDRERSTEEYTKNILEGLEWLGIRHDGDIPHQSDRGDIYRKHLSHLIETGAAYVSKEDPVKEGDRGEIIRFRNPNKKIVFHDLIRGDIEVDTTDLGDFVIAKDLESPLYHLAVVVDDFEMGVTHIIRGDDGIANTPRQILIQEALGAPRPVYAHIPLILSPDRSKLSKRHGAMAVTEYRDMGYLPEAVVNFLALLGWNPGTEQELFSMDELTEAFHLEKVQKGGAIFNTEKLDWFNKQYINKLAPAELRQKMFEALTPEIKESAWFQTDAFEKIIPIIQEKIVRFGEVPAVINDMRFFFAPPEYDLDKLLPPAKSEIPASDKKTQTAERINKTINFLQEIPENEFIAENIKAKLWDYATAEGRGNVLWPMRYALTGQEKSPDPFIVASVLGKNETLVRLAAASTKLN